METKDEIKETKGKRLRSPGYPMISLKESIERARILWDKDKNNLIPKEAAFKHLGFTHIGGYGARIIAALKHFGLISEKGNGIILTQDAVDLAIYKPTDEDYKNIVRKIALKPDIYRKIYNESNEQIPSDDTLRIKLIKEYKFNHDKVRGFISDFRKTLSFAGLTCEKAITIETGDDIKIDDMESTAKIQTIETIKPKGARTFNMSLTEDNEAILTLKKSPIGKDDIQIIKDWIDLLSKSIIKPESNDRQGE